MHAWLVVLFFFSFYSQAILSGTDVWYSSCFLFWCPSGGPLYAANRCLCLTDSWPRQRAGRRPTPATCHSRHRDSDSLLWPLASLPFHFPLLFQGNNTNFSVLENLPRNHNLTLLFPNDFWFVQSIFFFPLSLTHIFFYLLLFQNSANKWMLSFWSQMAWKFSTHSSSIRLSIGLHGNFSWIFAMLVICKSGHANVLAGPRSSWRSGKGH